MRQRIFVGILAATALAVAATPVMAAGAASFADVHAQASQLAAKSKWADAAKAYGAFAARDPRHALTPAAAILQAIILRRELSRGPEAGAALGPAIQAPDTALGRQLRDIARAWHARIQMEAIDQALRKYWVKKAWYPERLAELGELKLIDPKQLTDPWGKPFGYTTGPLRFAPKVPRQKYTLTCSAIQGDSKALKGLLKKTTELGKQVQLRSIVPSTPLKAIVTTAKAPERRLTVTEGVTLGAATVAAITPGGILLIDGEFIAFLLPATGR